MKKKLVLEFAILAVLILAFAAAGRLIGDQPLLPALSQYF
jgi:hypothetical protein